MLWDPTEVAKNVCGAKNMTEVTENVTEVTKNITEVTKHGFGTKSMAVFGYYGARSICGLNYFGSENGYTI